MAAPPYDAASAQSDRRTTALLLGSIELLKNLGVWELCVEHSAPLTGIRIVDDRAGLLRAPEVLFKAEDLGLESLGANLPNPPLVAALEHCGKTCAVDYIRATRPPSRESRSGKQTCACSWPKAIR